MRGAYPFWRAEHPLVLASASPTRRALLEGAGVPLEILKAPVDEKAIAASLLEESTAPREIAIALAHVKAEAASWKAPDRLLLTADQTLDHAGSLLMKPVDRAHARRQLLRLRGETHALHSAAVLRRGERVLWAGVASAALTMRGFSELFLETYLDAIGPEICQTVGGYRLEALGIQLFDTVEGDHATILGLPLTPVLHALRDGGFLLV
jgi:septum formation protein